MLNFVKQNLAAEFYFFNNYYIFVMIIQLADKLIQNTVENTEHAQILDSKNEFFVVIAN